MIHIRFRFVCLIQLLIAFSACCSKVTSNVQTARPENVFEKVFQSHCASLQYFSQANPKLLVMFSGTPGMGKSTVAKELEQYFKALRISVDDIRDLLRVHGLDSNLAQDYLMWCTQKLSKLSPNHFIILDCSIDRKYDECVKYAAQWQCPTFLIRMKVDKNKVIDRITSRASNVKATLQILDKLWADYELFGATHTSDYVYENNGDFKGTLEVEKLLEQLIAASSKFETLFKAQCSLLQYFSHPNQKLLIMFSGTPGMGKSTVAKELEQHLKAMRISVGQTRTLLKTYGLDAQYLEKYLVWSMQKLFKLSPNHCIILDCSIDRKYDTCIKYAAQWHCPTFLIRMNVERDVVEQRIKSRGKNVQALLANLDTWWNDYELFGAGHTPDYVYENNGDFKGTLEVEKLLEPLLKRAS